MNTPSFKEDHISQIPALQMLVNQGHTYFCNQELKSKAETIQPQSVFYMFINK